MISVTTRVPHFWFRSYGNVEVFYYFWDTKQFASTWCILGNAKGTATVDHLFDGGSYMQVAQPNLIIVK